MEKEETPFTKIVSRWDKKYQVENIYVAVIFYHLFLFLSIKL